MPIPLPPAALSPGAALAACSLLPTVFVGSFYLFPNATSRSRNEPAVIVQRFKAVGLTCLVGLGLVAALLGGSSSPLRSMQTALALTGIVSPAPLASVAVSLAACGLLFLGPLAVDVRTIVDDAWQFASHPQWRLQAVRNWIVGPVAEEIIFRGCLVPLALAGGLAPPLAVWLLPLLFGIAHLHHAWEMYRDGGATAGAAAKAAQVSAFQMCYTTVFGWIATYLFIHTGSIYGPIAAHMFCNIVGFPDLSALADDNPRRRVTARIAYPGGVALFLWLLGHMGVAAAQ
ncbi:CAAX prenyl protease [Polyrhizophydium stewartii]|uniref:intramembrane prenyl-peptidase Rce1 n=1 Tax=Polyrhizophydium stewartii TaxID=2732419 RepID=A0ABR4N6R4_9FUNG